MNLRSKYLLRLVFAAIVGVGVIFSVADSQTPAPAPTSPGPRPVKYSPAVVAEGVAHKLPNGLSLVAYPADSVNPFGLTWHVRRPIRVDSWTYDPKTHELIVGVDLGWRKADEDALRDRLEAQYKHVGKPINPKAINLHAMELAEYSILIESLGQTLVLANSKQTSDLSLLSLRYHVPMTPEGESLHRVLAGAKPETAHVVLLAGYRWEKMAGVELKRTALNSIWHDIREAINSDPKQPADLWVSTNGVQTIREKLASFKSTRIQTFGLTPEEEKVYVKEALDNINMALADLKTPTLDELLSLAREDFVFLIKNGQLAAAPTMVDDMITKLHEMKEQKSKVENLSKQLSDRAKDTDKSFRKFHKDAKKFVLDAKLSGSFAAIFSANASMHLDKQSEELTEDQGRDIDRAREIMQNESQFRKEVESKFALVKEGVMKKTQSLSKLLDIRRVSAAALAAVAQAGYTRSHITGTEVVYLRTPIELKATPLHPGLDVIEKLEMVQREHSVAIEKLQQGRQENAELAMKLAALESLTGNLGKRPQLKFAVQTICLRGFKEERNLTIPKGAIIQQFGPPDTQQLEFKLEGKKTVVGCWPVIRSHGHLNSVNTMRYWLDWPQAYFAIRPGSNSLIFDGNRQDSGFWLIDVNYLYYDADE